MPHPVIHAEIRSADPDAARKFYADLFDWKIASEGGLPGYTFIDTGVEGGTFVAISPRQGPEDEVLFFVAVEDVAATLKKAEGLGGTIIQPAQEVPGTTFGVFADAQGHRVGVAVERLAPLNSCCRRRSITGGGGNILLPDLLLSDC